MFLLQANTTALFNLSDLQLVAPEMILTVCACVVLVMEVILPYRKSKWTAYFALAGIGFALLSLLALFYSLGGFGVLSEVYRDPQTGIPFASLLRRPVI